MTFRQGAGQRPDHSDAQVLAFGDSRIDVHARELHHDGAVVSLEPRIFDLLEFMARHPHKALSKDELQAQIWPGQVVSDTVVSQAIMKARRAVGDSGQQQSVIATIHGYGYRFVAPVTGGSGRDQDQDPEPTPATAAKPDAATVDPIPGRQDDSQHPPRPRHGRRWLPAVLAGFAVILALVWSMQDHDPDATETAIIAILSSATAGDTPEPGVDGSALLARALASQSDLTIIASDRATRLLSAQGIAADADDGVVLTALNQALGVDYLLRAGLVHRDDQWQLDATLIDRQLRRTELPASHGSLVAMVTGMGHQLGAELGRDWRDDLPRSVLSEDDFANEAAARGLQALLAGDAASAASLLTTALSQAPEMHWARYELANAHLALNDTDQAHTLYSQVIADCRDSDPKLAGHALTQFGVMAWRAGDLDAAQAHFLEAGEHYTRIDHPHGAASVLGNLGILAENRGELAAADDLYGRALLRFRQAQDLVGESAVHTNQAFLARLRSRTGDAWQHQSRAVELQRRLGIGSMLVLSLTHLADLEIERGRPDVAMQLLDEAAGLAQAQADRAGEAGIELTRARLALDGLNGEQAVHLARSALATWQALGHGNELARASSRLAEALIANGAHDEALAVLAQVPADSGKLRQRQRLALLQARASLAGPSTAPDPELDRQLAQWRDGDDALLAAWVATLDAEQAERQQDTGQAIVHLGQALKHLVRLDEPHLRAELETRLAGLLIDQDDLEAAQILLSRALAWSPTWLPARILEAHVDLLQHKPDRARQTLLELDGLPDAQAAPLVARLEHLRQHLAGQP